MKGTAFCGAHRVGKTTLARALSTELNLAFVETPTSKVAINLGIDVSKNLDFKTRIILQTAILEAYEETFSKIFKENVPWISDRSPLDALAYTLVDTYNTNYLERIEFKSFIIKYQYDCIEMVNKYFQNIIHVRPGIEPVYAEGKASLSKESIYGIDSTLALNLENWLAAPTSPNLFKMDKDMLDLQERMEFCRTILSGEWI